MSEHNGSEKTMIVPLNVQISKHYRIYVECQVGADDSEIRRAALYHILDGQDDVLIRALDFDEIEAMDISFDEIDRDGIQYP